MIKLKTKQKKNCEQQSIENDVSKFIAVSTKKNRFSFANNSFFITFSSKVIKTKQSNNLKKKSFVFIYLFRNKVIKFIKA
jgi:hypothetical protein